MEEAQNQEQVIEIEESQEYTPSSKRLSEDEGEQERFEDDDEPFFLMRSTATAGRARFAEKEPMHGFGVQSQALSGDDEEEDSMSEDAGDLAWFFRKIHPEVDKYSQIAWCRTYANMLAAQMPKNRPTTYKKRKTNEK